jgi:hypothetical protein
MSYRLLAFWYPLPGGRGRCYLTLSEPFVPRSTLGLTWNPTYLQPWLHGTRGAVLLSLS